MRSKKWKLFYPALISLCFAGWSAHAQCLVSPMQSSGYGIGECHDLQFQQAIGTFFTGYGSCGELTFTSPLTETDVTTETVDGQKENRVRVYPNPLKDYLFIEAADFQTGDIRIYSLLGNLIYESTLKHDSQFRMDLTSFTNGVYLVKIILDDKKCSTYTIIKS